MRLDEIAKRRGPPSNDPTEVMLWSLETDSNVSVLMVYDPQKSTVVAKGPEALKGYEGRQYEHVIRADPRKVARLIRYKQYTKLTGDDPYDLTLQDFEEGFKRTRHTPPDRPKAPVLPFRKREEQQ